ncbi:MAG: cytochrome-c oxidase, cbb3-type subunit III [Burkholderiaceae bacterium]|nr:cytochrome-c oxidase, cbb3-type subunit III [Burkholderiaceae bacterium]
MSDFTSGVWDYFVAIISITSIAGCAVFLKMHSKVRAKLDEQGRPQTTDHVWDEDLREYQQPMPRWWVVLFYLTVAFGLTYLLLFPGLGTRYKGVLKWTSVGQFRSEVATADARFGPMFDAFLHRDLVDVAADPRAHQIGERIFLNNCSQCHGSDARGGNGFPDLTREEKIWGGTPEAIETTITGGREATMPPLAAVVGSDDDVKDLANYVRSLSHSTHDAARASRGQPKFVICAACHGPEGKGNQQIGAPNITLAVLRYGSSVDAVVDAIQHGHHGVMPAWKDVLTPAQIHLAAAYVYSFSHPAAGAKPDAH